MLMCRFNEFRGNIEFNDFEREFELKKSYIRLSKTKEKVHFGDFIKNKDNQVENIKKMLEVSLNDVFIFTDGSTNGNPGPNWSWSRNLSGRIEFGTGSI